LREYRKKERRLKGGLNKDWDLGLVLVIGLDFNFPLEEPNF